MSEVPCCRRCGGANIGFYGKRKERRCRDCRNTALAIRRGADPDARRRRGVDQEAKTRYRLKYRYGISVDEYKAAAESQRGKCAICHRDKPLVIDHCHATGKFRGLLCVPCNASLGTLEKPGWVEKASAYLAKHSESA